MIEPSNQSNQSSRAGDAKRVCLADDDAGIRASLRFLLEEAGYEVEEAENGEMALELLHADTRPRVLLLDRMMPRLDGVRTLRAISGEPDLLRRTAILFMTARNDPPEPEATELIQRYCSSSVSKPFNLDTVLDQVGRARASLTGEPAIDG